MGKEQMRQLAKRLALANAESEPTLQKVLWFPHDVESRLVEVMEDVVASDSVIAFHSGPDAPGGIPVPTAIALIRPQECGVIPLPEDWGNWSAAEEIEILRAREAS
jgi:hypothetical protein